ncbi:hypothetical protein BREVNS_0741 [Brevinematales bacterium NS]|nr:hypothetical protein BREVNS_0741 [Brevinematales bacterium NS]
MPNLHLLLPLPTPQEKGFCLLSRALFLFIFPNVGPFS